MIKANELRIGNFINNDLKSRVLETLSISGDLIFIEDNPQNYSPIPLTEEWLLKFGFAQSQWSAAVWSSEETTDVLLVQCDKHYTFQYNLIAGPNRIRFIEYVHQLQNLYFALTGEELTMKETV